MKLHDLVPADEMATALADGLIRMTDHPSLPLTIANYTEKAQFSRSWGLATETCRGLIFNRETLDIVARPFPKFFNFGESAGGTFSSEDMRDLVQVTDKLDGSLGILYETPGDNPVYMIATRGSFTSDQAKHATDILHSRYPDFVPPEGWTLLFEIIYPENRIVVDYGGMDDLVLLGSVHNDSGVVLGPQWPVAWPGPRAEVLTPTTLQEALSVSPRPGKEGMVVTFVWSDRMVKIKQADYIELHRIVTGLNERTVWERVQKLPTLELGRIDSSDKLVEGVPDELHDWVKSVASSLAKEFYRAAWMVEEAWEEVSGVHRMDPADLDRKEFALRVQMFHPWVRTCLFLKVDSKDYRPFLWKRLKPSGGKGPHNG